MLLPARSVRKRPGWETWEVEPTIVDRANEASTPAQRDQLVPVLAAAHARRAIGYDRLRAAVCANDDTMSDDRARVCATLPAKGEDDWRQSDRTKQWLVRGAATAVYAGAITTAFVERDHEASRTIATASAVPMAAMTGAIVGAAVVSPFVSKHTTPGGFDSPGATALVAGTVVAGAIAGAVLGARWTHGLASSPSAPAPVTAVALAPLYLTSLWMTIDW